jgi:integrase
LIRTNRTFPEPKRRTNHAELRTASFFLRYINVFVDYPRAFRTVERTELEYGWPMPKLTKRLVDASETRPTEYFVWDSEIPGFGLRVLPSGRKGYVVQYRAGRRSRRISLGPSTVLTCEQARSRAMTIISAARNGEDPAAERDAGRKAITVKELAERFDREHISILVKASTAKEYRRNLDRFILPALGQLTVIAGTLPGKRLSDLQPFWQRVRARAGLKNVRIHDLRHTFASTAVASGQGLPMIGKLLGHTQVQTTARYAHLAAEPVRMAADAVAQDLQQAMG